MNILEKIQKIKNIPVVCEFKDAFLKELLGLPPHREIDFKIELFSKPLIVWPQQSLRNRKFN